MFQLDRELLVAVPAVEPACVPGERDLLACTPSSRVLTQLVDVRSAQLGLAESSPGAARQMRGGSTGGGACLGVLGEASERIAAASTA